jgi:hypothetical protein
MSIESADIVLDEVAGHYVKTLAPMSQHGLPTYEVTLGSGAVVRMKAWPLSHSLAMVQSGGAGTDRDQFKELLDVCLDDVVDPGPYRFDKWDWDQVLFSDWDPAILAARIATHGPDLVIEQSCPNNNPKLKPKDRCSGTLQMANGPQTGSGFSIDLDRLLRNDVWAVPKVTREALSRGENRFTIKWADISVTFACMTGSMFKRFEAGIKQDKKLADDAVTWSLVTRILDLNGRTAKPDISKALRDPTLSASFAGVFKLMDNWDGGIEDTLHVFCPSCGWQDKEYRLPFVRVTSFWAPETGPLSEETVVPTRTRVRDMNRT